MNFDIEECSNIDNISEDEEYEYYRELLEFIKRNKKEIDTIKILTCFSNIMNAYYTGFHSQQNPYKYFIESWILSHWNPYSIEETEYVTEITIRLELENLYLKFKNLLREDLLSKNIQEELSDTIVEAEREGYFNF